VIPVPPAIPHISPSTLNAPVPPTSAPGSRCSTFPRLLAVLLTLLSFAHPALARQGGTPEPLTAEAQVESSTVSEGQTFSFKIWVRGTDAAEQPDLSGLTDFDVDFLGGGANNRTSVVIVNGKMQQDESRAYIFNWSLTPKKAGMLTIPAIKVKAEGKVLFTLPLSIRVAPPQPDNDVRLQIALDPPSPYVGEPTMLRVKLLLKQNVEDVTITFRGVEPTFNIPEPDPAKQNGRQQALDLLGERAPTRNAQETIDGEAYYTFSAERAILPAKPGETEIAGTIAAKIVTRRGDGFFDPGERRSVSVPSNAVKLTVRDLPTKGRPPGFNNLVGQFTVSASADPISINVGDPVTLKITVNGSGPMDRVPRPDLKRILGDRFRVPDDAPEPERRPGQVIFTQTIRPTTAEATTIPPIELPHFDTKSGTFSVAKSSPIPLRIAGTKVITATDAVAASPSAVESPELRERAGGLEANIESPTLALTDQRFDLAKAVRSPAVLAVAATPAAVYAGTALMVFVKRRNGANPARTRRRLALGNATRVLVGADGANATEAVARALTGYVADRFNVPQAGLTPRDCEERLKPVNEGAAAEVRALLDRCDAARFAGLSAGEASDLRSRALAVLQTLETVKGGTR
jgi:hypothetical protein